MIHGAAPTTPPSRHRLSAIDDVRIGRGPRLHVRRERAVLVVEVPDPWMSSRHARLQRRPASFVLHDERSKNGTCVDGKPIAQQATTDALAFRTGRTRLLIRVAGIDDPDAPDDLFADALDGPIGLRTLEPALGGVPGRAAREDGMARVDSRHGCRRTRLHGEPRRARNVGTRSWADRRSSSHGQCNAALGSHRGVANGDDSPR